MKKYGMVIAALSLVAALLSGCALPALLLGATQLTRQESAKQAEVYEPEVMDGAETEEYMADMAMENGMVANTYATAMGFVAPPEFNTEEYAATRENGFRKVATDPLSTFSADVDTASYCNLRRMLNDGYAPDEIPAGAVRVEEMLNYFRYGYDEPRPDAKFGITAQMAPCPWNKDNVLLALGVRTADAPEAADEGSNLVFLVDVSGSMYDDNKLPLAQKALTMLTDTLGEKDTVSIVTYANGEDILIEGANPVKDKAKLLAAIDALEAGGSTNGQRGLAQAYEVAQKYLRPKGNNRVIMCSDGDLNVGITSESELHDYVTEKKQPG